VDAAETTITGQRARAATATLVEPIEHTFKAADRAASHHHQPGLSAEFGPHLPRVAESDFRSDDLRRGTF
jgi:hypothetical protein